MLSFRVTHEESVGRARVGVLTTGRSEVATPAFMPVGSLGNVRSVDGEELLKMGYGLILNNAYHLFLRPGHKVVEELGGVHGFTAWRGAILTDSGGFQVFSLAKFCKVTDEGVIFQSHIDGSSRFISPETSIEVQEALGADIIMAFDHVVALPSPMEQVRDAAKRTSLWARRCASAKRRPDQSLFGIVQGGVHATLRVESARDLVSVGFDGFAVGGLSVGEGKADMYSMLDVTVPELPSAKPRYLMGVGMPEDLVEGVARGIDMFDCVVPSRHGRTGWLFTSFGRVVIKQARYARDEQTIDSACRCPVCTRYTRAYLHHLFGVKEMLGARLNTIHNLWFFAQLMQEIRSAVRGGTFQEFRRKFTGLTWLIGRRARAGVISGILTFLNVNEAGGTMWDSMAWAQGTSGSTGAGGGLLSLVPFVIIFVIFYFMLILPQQKRKKQADAMLASLKKGDKVVTASGIWGTITNMGKDTVTLQIADNTKIKIQKEHIARLRGDEED